MAATDTKTRRRVAALRRRLCRAYGIPRRRRRLAPLDELILTILSQNTTDANSGRAFAALRARFPTWEELARADARTVARTIRAGGLADVKAKYIKKTLREIRKRRGRWELSFLHKMSNAEALSWLESLPGVGAKTARVVLLFSLARDVFAVDTHVLRLTKRLGFLPPNAGAAAAHEFWDDFCPPGAAAELHLNLIRHGREVCRARRPGCGACVLAALCPARREFV